jgi:hypothetical protein
MTIINIVITRKVETSVLPSLWGTIAHHMKKTKSTKAEAQKFVACESYKLPLSIPLHDVHAGPAPHPAYPMNIGGSSWW